MRSLRRVLPALSIAAVAMAGLSACGSEGITVAESDPSYAGAQLFSQRCSGCHTLTAAGAQGSADRELRIQGPNLDQREVDYEDALFAIQNGGFSGAIMPQNIVVGEEAESVAEFVAEHSGTDVEEPPQPGSDSE